MSSFYDITRTMLQTFSDLGLSVDWYVENEDYQPPTTGIHAVVNFLFNPTESGSKGGDNDFDVVSGIMQISLRDADTGTLGKDVYDLADLIAAGFKHGDNPADFESIHVDNTSLTQGRVIGGYYQMDVSVSWFSYIDR